MDRDLNQFDDPEGPASDIPILLDGTVRWVTGLTKRTTCDDVIYALLYNDGHHEGETTDSYAIFERWKEVERPLQARTKIVKIWKAWGAEQCNVELSVRKLDDYYVPGESFRTKRRHKRTKHRTRHNNDCGCRPGTHRSCYNAGKLRSLESLVKLVVAQEKKLKDLNERIGKTDEKIDNFETRRHFTRVQQNGNNYVQSAYLDSLSEDSMDEFLQNVRVEHLEEYLDFCDRIIHLEERLMEEHSKVKDLSKRVQEAMAANDGVFGVSSLYQGPAESNLPLQQQLEQVQVEMHRLISAGIMQRYQEDNVKKDLQQCDRQVEVKRQLIRSLKHDLHSLDLSVSMETTDDLSVSTEDDDDRVSIIQVYDSPPKSRIKSVSFDDRLNHMHVIGTSRENLSENHRQNNFKSRQPPPSSSSGGYFNDRCYLKQPDPKPTITSILKNKEQTVPNFNHQHLPGNTPSEHDRSGESGNSSNNSCELDRLTHTHDSGRYHLPSGIYTFANDGHYSLLDPSYKQCTDEDSNSDTGLSSMHSDESPGLETLV